MRQKFSLPFISSGRPNHRCIQSSSQSCLKPSDTRSTFCFWLFPKVVLFFIFTVICLNLSTYITRENNLPPPFPIQTWNHRMSVIQNLGRTNNAIEGFHRSLKDHFQREHPALSRLRQFFKWKNVFIILFMHIIIKLLIEGQLWSIL